MERISSSPGGTDSSILKCARLNNADPAALTRFDLDVLPLDSMADVSNSTMSGRNGCNFAIVSNGVENKFASCN